ncbi:MAG TPA: hypothetical protein VGJ87_26915 [Roseiflexaceae bacterium]|jgi:hypothetical protein
MKRLEVTILDSNCAAFPAGSRAWGQEDSNELTELAEHFTEVVSYVGTTNRVEVRTALGYHFIISTADYHRLIAA